MVAIAAVAIADIDWILMWKMPGSFGKHKIPGDAGLHVNPNTFFKKLKCGGREMLIGSTGKDNCKFLSIATEM